jgi:VWFA-related protein
MLSTLAVLLSVLPLQEAPPAPEMRTIVVSVSDEKGQPIRGLTLEEVALIENGVARDVSELTPDERPLTLALLVDSSEPVGTSYRLNVVEAVLRFVASLPQGTRYTLWTTGDRPTKIVELTDDRGAAAKALKRTYPIGGNTMLDALVEAARDLRTEEGARTAVVAVSGAGIEFSNRSRDRVVEEAQGAGATFLIVQFEEEKGPIESRQNYDYVFSTLAKKTGGLREFVLSAMGIEPALRKVATELTSHYRLRYVTLPEIKERKLELQVARPGARARVVGTPR